METINISCTIPGENAGSWDNMVLFVLSNVIKPKITSYSNIGYLGTTSSNTGKEMIFSIDENDNYFLRIGRTTTSNGKANAGLNSYISKSRLTDYNYASNGDSVRINNYLHGIVQSGIRATISGDDAPSTLSSRQYNTILYTISDANNNLKVLWEMAATQSYRAYPSPMIFTKTISGRDIIISFGVPNNTSSGIDTNNNPTVVYMDDPNRVIYYLKNDTRKFSSSTETIKISGLPITATNGGEDVIDSVNNEMVQIINTDLGSINGNGVYNNGGYVRKLIRIGNKYYRQLTSNWWFEDPKGDEPVEYVDETTYSS